MPLPKILGKAKGLVWPHKRNTDRLRPVDTGRPHTPHDRFPHDPSNRSSASGSNHSTSIPIVISPLNEGLTGASSTADSPHRPPAQPSLIVHHGTILSVTSPHPANTPDSSRNAYRTPSRISSHRQKDILQDSTPTAESHDIQNAAFRGEGTLTNAHDFTIVNAYMNDGGQTEEERQAAIALERLAAKGMPGAMLNSRERAYAPRCDEDTRQTLRDYIVNWTRTIGETRRLLWLSGPAGVGKSAVAQTVAEQLKIEGLLGAVFFFSRPNDRSDPDVVIPTLVYQLALLLPEYQRIVTQRLVKDPLILSKDRRSLFKELIIDPFRIITYQSPSPVQRPLVVVLDGLDECRDRKAQCEFVEVISHHAHLETDLCLRWIICSRPEPDLKVAFSSDDCSAICFKKKLEVDDSEAQRDARRILRRGFAEIKKRYPDQLAQDWPTDDQVRLIADRASGHLGFVSFIIRFIGDEHYDDPSGQLDVCLEFLKRTGGSTDINPLHALDLLYTQILSDIPTNILPTTHRILGLFMFYGNKHLTVAAHVNFLGLTQTSFYRAVQRLHSVLIIPSVFEAGQKPIQMHHASFSDYLKDPTRSGKFVLEEEVVPHLEIATSGLKWLRHARKGSLGPAKLELTWIPPKTSREIVLDSLCRFSFAPCWKACPRVPEDSVAMLVKELKNFDFNLAYSSLWRDELPHAFAYFIRWLASLGAQATSLITINPCAQDIARYERQQETFIWHEDCDPHAFAMPLLKPTAPAGPDGYTIYVLLGRSNRNFFILKVNNSWPLPGFT